MKRQFPPQVCPPLDRPLMRRAEARINLVSGIVIGSFLYWIGKAILVAFLAGRFAAVAGGR